MFQFSLEPVLDVRRRAEEQAQRDMAATARRLAEAEERIEVLRQMRAHIARERLEICARGFQPALLELYGHYIADLREKIVEQDKLRRQIADELEQRRLRLVEAAQDKQVMEEMKKMEWESHVQHELMEERKRNDDIAIFAYGRREAQGE